MVSSIKIVFGKNRGLSPMTSVAARGTVQLLAARGFFLLSGYAITVILARGLGPVDFGTYGFIMSVLLWIELVGSAGIPGATARLIPEYESQTRKVEQTAIVLLMAVSLLLFSFCWIVAPIFGRFSNIPGGTTLFRIAILDLPFTGFYFTYHGVLSGHRQFGTLSLGIFTYSLTKVIGILVLLIAGISVSAALVVNVLATIGALIYLNIKFPPAGLRPSYKCIRLMVHLALGMGLYLVCLQVLLSLDLWFLKIMWEGSGAVIGFYVASLNIAKLPIIIPSVLSNVLFASLSWALARSDKILAQRYIQGAGRFAFVVLVPCCVIVFMEAESLMEFIYSDIYVTGGMYLRLQIIAFVMYAFLDLCFHALMADGKHYQSAGFLLGLIPLAILFNLIFIPIFGPMGAAGSLLLTIGLGTTAGVILAYRRFGSLIRLLTVARVIMAVSAMVIIGHQIAFIADLPLLLKSVVLLGIYVLCLSLLKELNKEDLKPFAVWQKRT